MKYFLYFFRSLLPLFQVQPIATFDGGSNLWRTVDAFAGGLRELAGKLPCILSVSSLIAY